MTFTTLSTPKYVPGCLKYATPVGVKPKKKKKKPPSKRPAKPSKKKKKKKATIRKRKLPVCVKFGLIRVPGETITTEVPVCPIDGACG